MALKLQDNTDEVVDVDELLDENFNDDDMEDGLLCSDFDNSMIDRDFGFLLFLEKLSDPKFWTMSAARFKKILLPQAYEVLINRALNETLRTGDSVDTKSGLVCDDCLFLLFLKDDIVALYALIKDLSKDETAELNIEDPRLNEFARKMAAFDKLLIKIDAILMKQMDGRLLMRTRFFARKRKDDVRMLSERVISRTVDDNVVLDVHEQNQGVIKQNIRKSDLKPLHVNREIKVIEETRRFIARVVRRGVLATVVTTNLTDIVDTFVRASSYKPLISRVEGSTLAEYEGTDLLKPMIKGRPVIASEKEAVALKLQEEFGRRLLFAIGDSSRGDGYMGVRSLINGGLFVAVGKEFEATRAKFEPVARKAREFGVEDVDRKILYISHGNVNNGV